MADRENGKDHPTFHLSLTELMTTACKTPFLFPIRAGDISLFCHPDPSTGLDKPHFVDGDLCAGNGFIAIRARRGLWLESDFEKPDPSFLNRLGNLPWHLTPDPQDPEWRSLDDIRGQIYRNAPIALWNDQGRRHPSPIWRVAQSQFIRLSHLQLIARLPGAKIYAGDLIRLQPIYITFVGGTVILPYDQAIPQDWSFDIFKPTYHLIDGTRDKRTNRVAPCFVPPPKPEPAIDGWPPAEPQDD
jgi:hypothetical protein